MRLLTYFRRKTHLQREKDELEVQVRLARLERDQLEILFKQQREELKRRG